MGGFLVSTDAYAIPLAPLGRGSDTIGGTKLQQPSLKQVQVLPAEAKAALSPHAVHSYTLQMTGPTTSQSATQDVLAKDLTEGQYFVTGDLTPEVFADDCRQMLVAA